MAAAYSVRFEGPTTSLIAQSRRAIRRETGCTTNHCRPRAPYRPGAHMVPDPSWTAWRSRPCST